MGKPRRSTGGRAPRTPKKIPRGVRPPEIPGFLIAADAIVPCACGAVEGEPCITRAKDKKPLEPGCVHLGRRVRRLLLTGRAPDQRERLEAEAVAMVLEESRKLDRTA
jgi:hypothetical protein